VNNISLFIAPTQYQPGEFFEELAGLCFSRQPFVIKGKPAASCLKFAREAPSSELISCAQPVDSSVNNRTSRRILTMLDYYAGL
jgi:hypothetical protein